MGTGRLGVQAAGKHLLANARFSLNQNRHFRPTDLTQQVPGFLSFAGDYCRGRSVWLDMKAGFLGGRGQGEAASALCPGHS